MLSAIDAADSTKSLHLLLATVEDPSDPKAWSGTPFHMLRALEARFGRVTVLSSRRPERSVSAGILRLLLGRDRYPLWMTGAALKHYAGRLDQAIAQHQPDAVLCISSQHLVQGQSWPLPVFMVSDAPWRAYKEAYKEYDALPMLANRYAALEAKAAHKVTGVIYPTPWACAEAMSRFKVDADRIDCVPFGANRYCGDSDEVVTQRIRSKVLEPVRFLFVGKDWERKGGPLALRLVQELNRLGCQSRLSIIGCNPPIPADMKHAVDVLGFLSPVNASDQHSLQEAFEQAHFFWVPSRAECFGLVFAEAQSFGLPCISLTSHGIPGVVDSGTTGLLFDAATALSTMVEQILPLLQDRTAYQSMALAARMKFRKELNWEAFGTRVHQRIAHAWAESVRLRSK